MVNITIFLHFVCLLYAAPAPGETPAMLPLPETVAQDSMSLLTNVWGLRERLHKEEGEFQPIKPFEPIRLEFYLDSTYKLIRQHNTVNFLNSIETVEWGNWEINMGRGYISVQVTNVDGRSILSAMLYRWQIEKLTPQQLILNQIGPGEQLLVFERAK
ncbi:hypothetical protein [Pontibacter pamirensis]|uniref:hypothetical protein n=1 Tax=Pontibacter pamirensis TaxID=2562824 RepID=UPI0013898081|nr:hypothetical protein [Pontibacter pamirensis]